MKLNYLQTNLLDLSYGNAMSPSTWQLPETCVKLLDKEYKDKNELVEDVRKDYYKYPGEFKEGVFDSYSSQFYADIVKELINSNFQISKEIPRLKTSVYRYVITTDIGNGFCFPMIDLDLAKARQFSIRHEAVADKFYKLMSLQFLSHCQVFKMLSGKYGRWYIFDYPILHNQIPMFNGLVQQHHDSVCAKLKYYEERYTQNERSMCGELNTDVLKCAAPYDYKYLKYANGRRKYCMRAIAKIGSHIPCEDKSYNDFLLGEKNFKKPSKEFKQFTELLIQYFDSEEIQTLAMEMNL